MEDNKTVEYSRDHNKGKAYVTKSALNGRSLMARIKIKHFELAMTKSTENKKCRDENQNLLTLSGLKSSLNLFNYWNCQIDNYIISF